MSPRNTVQSSAHFERHLRDIDAFLTEAGAPQAFDALLDALTDTVIPNLERFPGMGRPFLERPVRSVEAAHGVERLSRQLHALDPEGELREYVMAHYLLLYARIQGTVVLLSIRHHKQLSFDFVDLWGPG